MLDRAKFLRGIPDVFEDIFKIIRTYGFVPTLVGGTVRDFLLTSGVGNDWDLELTHPTNAFNKNHWKDFGRDLSRIGKISFLSYEIIRLDVKGFQFEFSPPRREIFREDWDKAGHSNFEAEFDFQMEFAEAILRRDFTINSIGIRFHSLKEFDLLDPAGGVIHLRSKLLHHTGADFAKDPVRFLRAIRFTQKMGLEFTPELAQVLKEMNVQGISPAYLWSELQKSTRPLAMLKSLFDWQKVKPELGLPLHASDINGKWEELTHVLTDTGRHETWMIALEWVGISAQSWQKYFSVSSETSSRLARWAQSSKKFVTLLPETFHGEFEVVCQRPEFDLVFDWYFTTKQLLQKNSSLPLLQMIESYLPAWIHLYRFDPVKDVRHIDPPLRAKYQVWNLCQRL